MSDKRNALPCETMAAHDLVTAREEARNKLHAVHGHTDQERGVNKLLEKHLEIKELVENVLISLGATSSSLKLPGSSNQHVTKDQQSLRSALIKLRKTNNYLKIVGSHGFEVAEKFKLSELDLNEEEMEKLYKENKLLKKKERTLAVVATRFL